MPVKMTAVSFAHLVRLMLDGERDCRELAEETGLHYVTVLSYTRELHRKKAAHICKWLPDDRGRFLTKVYKIGAGRDARRPKASDAERQAAYKSRKLTRASHLAVGGIHV